MGVFSLLSRPTVEFTNTVFTNINGVSSRRFQFKLPQQLRYVINPASGLEVQDFQVALVQVTNSDYPERLPVGWEYEGVAAQPSGTSLHVFRTPYVNSGCLANTPFSLETIDPRFQTLSEVVISPSSSTTFLKFILNLRRPGSPATEQNTLIVLKYPVTTQLVTRFSSTGVLPCVAVQPQASTNDVQAICSGSVYQAAIALRPSGPTGAGSSAVAPAAAVARVEVYPNPATDAATIRFEAGTAGLASACVLDMYGKQVLTIMQDEPIAAEAQQYSFPTAGLPAGLYRCVLTTADGKRVSTPLSIVR